MRRDNDHLEPYRRAVAEHGPTFPATLWSSPRTQRTRFEVITQMVDLAGATVLDAGSGLCDLPAYLDERGIRCNQIIALEALDELARAGAERRLPRVRTMTGDFIADHDVFERAARTARSESLDVVIFCGSLNSLTWPDARSAIDRAWPCTRRALVFNFVSAMCGRSPAETHPAVPFSPVEVLAHVASLSPSFALRHDYMGDRDATAAIYREHR